MKSLFMDIKSLFMDMKSLFSRLWWTQFSSKLVCILNIAPFDMNVLDIDINNVEQGGSM